MKSLIDFTGRMSNYGRNSDSARIRHVSRMQGRAMPSMDNSLNDALRADRQAYTDSMIAMGPRPQSPVVQRLVGEANNILTGLLGYNLRAGLNRHQGFMGKIRQTALMIGTAYYGAALYAPHVAADMEKFVLATAGELKKQVARIMVKFKSQFDSDTRRAIDGVLVRTGVVTNADVANYAMGHPNLVGKAPEGTYSFVDQYGQLQSTYPGINSGLQTPAQSGMLYGVDGKPFDPALFQWVNKPGSDTWIKLDMNGNTEETIELPNGVGSNFMKPVPAGPGRSTVKRRFSVIRT